MEFCQSSPSDDKKEKKNEISSLVNIAEGAIPTSNTNEKRRRSAWVDIQLKIKFAA